MVDQRFRIRESIIAMVIVDGRYAVFHTQPGDTIRITKGPLDGVMMVQVDWNGQEAIMFTMEVRAHADLISGPPDAGYSFEGA